MVSAQDGQPRVGAGPVSHVLVAVVTAVVGWTCFQFGTQGRLVAAYALPVALVVGVLAGILVGLLLSGWVTLPRRRPKPEPELEEAPEPDHSDPDGADLVALIRRVMAEQQPRFAEVGTALQAMMSGRVRVDAEPEEIAQGLITLLDDAFEATKRLERGEVLVGLARKTVADGSVARITVTDNRVGATTTLTLPLMGSEQALMGSEQPPMGSEQAPRGSEQAPRGSEQAPRGSEQGLAAAS